VQQYTPDSERYEVAEDWFRPMGATGLKISALSLGTWHNFGGAGTDSKRLDEPDLHENCRRILFTAFDLGINHFDLANAYGPPPGTAEERVGRILRDDFGAHREEIVIATKAGVAIHPGPNAKTKNRKNLLPRLDESLRRLGTDYVDIWYVHGPDEGTPLEETLGALDQAVRSGKALYTGVSSYQGDMTSETMRICERNGLVKPRVHQPIYNMRNRWIEDDLLPVTAREGMGVISFMALGGGRLTEKYLNGIPNDSRAASESTHLSKDVFTPSLLSVLRKLDDHAKQRGQSLAQMAIAWVLQDPRVTSTIIGASRPEQVTENVKAFENTSFSEEELNLVDAILAEEVR
jgi:L-glyceraldehyde 3-phosphate reductase